MTNDSKYGWTMWLLGFNRIKLFRGEPYEGIPHDAPLAASFKEKNT